MNPELIRLPNEAFRRPKSIGFIGLPKTDFGRIIPHTRP